VKPDIGWHGRSSRPSAPRSCASSPPFFTTTAKSSRYRPRSSARSMPASRPQHAA
jgi:hypothetical protein